MPPPTTIDPGIQRPDAPSSRSSRRIGTNITAQNRHSLLLKPPLIAEYIVHSGALQSQRLRAPYTTKPSHSFFAFKIAVAKWCLRVEEIATHLPTCLEKRALSLADASS